MAGFRRSGIGEMDPDRETQELQPSMAQPLAAEVAESAGEASPRSPQTNRATKAFCRNCKNSIGDFYNSWYKVTGTYYVPALLGSYSSTLRPMGKLKAASKGTELAGCTIQPLSCPYSHCHNIAIGFTVITAPAGKGSFRGRDFFKLGRVELQCEIATNQFIVVEPKLDTSSDLLANEDTPSPSSSVATPNASSAEAMEIDSRAPSLEYADGTYGRTKQSQDRDIQQQQQQHPLQPIEGSRQSVTAPPSRHSPSIRDSPYVVAQDLPGNSIQSPSLHHQGAHRSHKGPGFNPTSGQLEAPTVAPQDQSSIETSQTNGHYYPRSPQHVGIDAMACLQTQMSQNSGALAAHTRDIRIGQEAVGAMEETIREFQTKFIRQTADIQRIEALAARLQNEVQGMRHAMESINHELQASRMQGQSAKSAVPPVAPSFAAQSSAMEIMARQLHDMSHKTSDLDNLKLHVEIMKDKIYRLEERAGPEPSQAPPHVHQAPQGPVVQSQPALTTVTSHQDAPTTTPNNRAPQPILNGQPQQSSFGAPSTTAAAPSVQPTNSQASGWATVNAGVKRAHQNGAETPQACSAHAPEPPKRQRLMDDGTSGYTTSQQTPVTDHRFQTPTQMVPSQPTVSESAHGSQSQQSYHVPYATQDGPSDASWQPESQRLIEHRPRGRPRGSGGLGSRGGRGRKSMPAQLHSTLGTPEWERDDWQGVPDSQTSPAGYYNHVGQPGRGGIARRGSGGGGGRGGYATSDRASSLGLQGVIGAMSFGSPGDPYGLGKKTRTKPIRNADGVLIRKDGRPDMRSQSSAANLRKVHERKEGQASRSPTGSSFTPTNLQYTASADAPDTPSPSGYVADPNATDKHNAIMGKMFPDGIDAARKKQDYTRQVFEENRNHTAHPRSQNGGPATKTADQVKKEQVDRNRIPETQSPQEQGEDVDMDEGEDHADDEGSSHAGDGVQLGNQTQDATTHENSRTQTVSQSVLETRAADSSVTVGAESTQTQ